MINLAPKTQNSETGGLFECKYKLMGRDWRPYLYIKKDVTMIIMVDHICECSRCNCKVKFDCNESGCQCCSTSICYLDWFKD